MIYNINIKARIESNLTEQGLKNKLVLALYDYENQYSKIDKIDEELEVVEYEATDVYELCPSCETKLIERVFDIDGVNLVNKKVCEKCGYGKPAIK